MAYLHIEQFVSGVVTFAIAFASLGLVVALVTI